MNIVVSWIFVVCIFIIVANVLKSIYNFLFHESKIDHDVKKISNREFQKVYENARYEYEARATGTEGRLIEQNRANINHAEGYSSYEEYRKKNRISR